MLYSVIKCDCLRMFAPCFALRSRLYTQCSLGPITNGTQHIYYLYSISLLFEKLRNCRDFIKILNLRKGPQYGFPFVILSKHMYQKSSCLRCET